jgi:hypothetical protein
VIGNSDLAINQSLKRNAENAAPWFAWVLWFLMRLSRIKLQETDSHFPDRIGYRIIQQREVTLYCGS